MNFFDWDTAKVTVASFTGLTNWMVNVDIWMKCAISFASLVYIVVKLHQLVKNKGK
mgnify:CR=1 FL=1